MHSQKRIVKNSAGMRFRKGETQATFRSGEGAAILSLNRSGARRPSVPSPSTANREAWSTPRFTTGGLCRSHLPNHEKDIFLPRRKKAPAGSLRRSVAHTCDLPDDDGSVEPSSLLEPTTALSVLISASLGTAARPRWESRSQIIIPLLLDSAGAPVASMTPMWTKTSGFG